MKYFFTIFTLVFFQFSGLAQNDSKSKEETAVASRVETLRQAMIDADGKKLKELTSSALSYGHSSGKIENQAIFIEKIANGESDFVTIEFQNQTIEMVGDVAIVRHNLAAHTKDGGVDKDIKIGILLVWQKQKNKWLLIARQAFKLPS
ncbi:nuclear transport factor 2 family protein [Flavobacterium eburneipallidum]|uniref:nuclear transport factor 2 family protein n=1 Tax=Flavobacterium eburneipallidum TaxID=3003263 RepID=UPI00248259B5|nr:nuclear transport factor 2 family protein [Flavobacterium eburneipallidum]